METKEVKDTTTTFYEPSDQCIHATKFTKNLQKQQKYLKTTRIAISDKSKLQFYTKQMIDSGIFGKKEIIDWEEKIKADKASQTQEVLSEAGGRKRKIRKRERRHGQKGVL